MTMRKVLVATLAAACLFPATALAVADGPAGGFTPEEAERLRKGRSVARPLEGHDRLVGGNAWVVVRSSPDEVWRALTDLSAYRRVFGFVDRIEIIRSSGERRTVRIEEQEAYFTLSYLVQLRIDEGRREIEFRLDPSTREHVRDGWGFVHLDAMPDGRTLVTYGAAVNPGNDMIRSLFEEGMEARLLDAPERLKRLIERDSRRRVRARVAAQGRRAFPRVRSSRAADRAAEIRARAAQREVAVARAEATHPEPAAQPAEPRPDVPFALPPDAECLR